jgi:hypothetical protein
MNVSATTFVANTGTVGSTIANQTHSVTSGTIAVMNVTDQTTISGDVYVKTTLGGTTINAINNENTNLRTRVTQNISDLNTLDQAHATNETRFDDISGEYQAILQNEFPTLEKQTDLSGRCEFNETNIDGISNETYALETANAGGYPSDGEQDDLSGRIDVNVVDTEILFIRVYGVKDDVLDGDFADASYTQDIIDRIDVNEANIQDASEGYAIAFASVNTLATQENYDDLSERATDVSNTIEEFIGATNLFGYNDVSNRSDDVSNNIRDLGDLCNNLVVDIQAQPSRIVDISQNISVGNDGVMVGVSANVSVSGVEIGERDDRNLTYFNSKVNDLRGPVTISGTVTNLIQPRSTINTDFVNEPRDVSSIIVDFTSVTPYAQTHHILLDSSESVVSEPPILYETFDGGPIVFQSDGGTGLDLRISRLSRSRRIVVTIPPACASRFTITLYDDDTLTNVSGGYGYDMSGVRRDIMESSMGTYKSILGGNPLTGGSLYSVRDSIQISPACAPSIDVSFLNLNSFQKTELVQLLENDVLSLIDVNGTPRLQYHYNPIQTSNDVYNGGSVFHLVRNISTNPSFTLADGISFEQINRLEKLSSMNESEGINDTNNVTLNGIPSFLLNQTLDRQSFGNRFDIIFTGGSRFVHESMGGVLTQNEIAGPFDYYGGNSYTFEINLVSTGRPEHANLAKLYITEKTRQAPLRRFYKGQFVNQVLDITNDNIINGAELVRVFGGYKTARFPQYPKLDL